MSPARACSVREAGSMASSSIERRPRSTRKKRALSAALLTAALAAVASLPLVAQGKPGTIVVTAAQVAAARNRAASAAAGSPLEVVALFEAAPYRLELQHRTSSPQAPVERDGEAEMVIVLDGTGAVTIGRTSRELAPGDQFFIPERTTARYVRVDGALVTLSLRLPRPVRPCCVYLGQMGWVPGGSRVDTTFISNGDVNARLDMARREQGNLPISSTPIVQLLPYTSHVEYREARPEATRMLMHGSEAEIFFVMDGAATIMTGGTLVDQQRTGGDNLRGTSVTGATAHRIQKGDIVFVPVATPHGFSGFDPAVTLRSLHVPYGATF
jgi:mannose-6-phosphate isomerase-like protein (cupin superfamily)